MTAGLPTDDPWGDRQEDLPLADFDALVAGGLSFAAVPRTAWEYSNLGYALLGRVISAATGRDYREYVRTELLEPLGMTSTGYDVGDVPAGRLAQGYAPVDAGLVPEPFTGSGAFSPMGGPAQHRARHRHVGRRLPALAGRTPASTTTRSTGGAGARCRSRSATSPRCSPRPTECRAGRGVDQLRVRSRRRRRPAARAHGVALAAATPASGRTCAGTRPPAGAWWCWPTAPTPRRSASAPSVAAIVGAQLDEGFVPSVAHVGAHARGHGGRRAAARLVGRRARRRLVRGERRPRPAPGGAAYGVRAGARGRSVRVVRDASSVVSTSPSRARWHVTGPGGGATLEVLLTPEATPLIQTLTVTPDPAA